MSFYIKSNQVKSGNIKPKDNKLIWKIHHFAGFYSGIVIAVLCFTGSAAVFIPEIDFLIQKGMYSASSSSTKELHFENSLKELGKKHPGYRSLRIQFPEKQGRAGIINLTINGKKNTDENRIAYFIDMGADRLIAARNPQNTMANYLRQIHVRLYEGNWGRYFVGLGGIAFTVVTVTGLMIYGNFMKRQIYPQVRKERGLRIMLSDWHKLLGISALAFNLVIALTGAWLGFQGWFNIKNPAKYEAPVIMEKEADIKTTVNWHEVLTTSRQYFPDLIPKYAIPSENGSGTVLIAGNIKGLIYERNINKLILSKEDLKPLYKYDIREKPFWHKFYFVQEALHFGDYGGLALKILYAMLGLVASFLAISGFIIYFFRTEKKVKRKANPLKIIFLNSIIILMLLILIALVSTLIGYSTAAIIMSIVINGGLATSILYLFLKFLIKKKTILKPYNI
jgi:uncharacterized iron-regulated membrane protein